MWTCGEKKKTKTGSMVMCFVSQKKKNIHIGTYCEHVQKKTYKNTRNQKQCMLSRDHVSKKKYTLTKLLLELEKLCYGLNEDYVDPVLVAQKVCLGVHKGVTTSALDELAAEKLHILIWGYLQHVLPFQIYIKILKNHLLKLRQCYIITLNQKLVSKHLFYQN